MSLRNGVAQKKQLDCGALSKSEEIQLVQMQIVLRNYLIIIDRPGLVKDEIFAKIINYCLTSRGVTGQEFSGFGLGRAMGIGLRASPRAFGPL